MTDLPTPTSQTVAAESLTGQVEDEAITELAAPAPVGAAELAAHLAARMCHDYISPAGAIISGLDLLEDPSAQDMREEAMNLIASSAKKLVDHLAFDRVALGSSAAAETFDPRALETLAKGVFAHGRAELVWAVEAPSLNKPAARALLNLTQVGLGALPTGGIATVTAKVEGDQVQITVDCKGARARLRPAVVDGLEGRRLGEGLAGLWVQAYYLRQIVDSVGGTLDFDVGEERVSFRVSVPV
jgi:histidine phosphotransferase ChpT